jgi:hypothetical protein
MKLVDDSGTWVVYLMTIHKQVEPMNAVCSQDEWDAMERSRPGHHPLVHAGIASEREAELLARGTSGDAKPRQSGPRSWQEPTAEFDKPTLKLRVAVAKEIQ